MSPSTLCLCDRCGEVVEIDDNLELRRVEEFLGESVVVHCDRCYREATGR